MATSAQNSTKAKRARLPRERRRMDIMAAARAVFVEKGYEEAAMSEIAARADLVEGSLYRFFKTKRDLLIAVLEVSYEKLLADYDLQLAGISGVRNRLRFMIWRLLVAFQENPDLTRLLYRHIRSEADYLSTRIYELNRKYAGHMDAILTEGIASGELRAETPLRLVPQMILGGIDQLTWRHRMGVGQFDPARTADEMTEFVYRGLVAGNHSAGGPQDDVANRLEATSRDLAATTARLASLSELQDIDKKTNSSD
ncbi:MAG: TetR/AcrR family transcriptional regulator [Alphaproteobacteria bacterium]|nr:TetR/AcrR family transcriptional regulator [Alphaproteobacteria bacterium]